MNIIRPKISLSISDIPLGLSIRKHFELASDLGVDGVEVVIGYKTRASLRKLEKLSLKYNVRILSVHEPAWSFLKIAKDKLGFRVAEYFGAKYVAHPSFIASLNIEKTLFFLEWLSLMAKKHNVEVLLENLSLTSNYRVFKPFLKRDYSITNPLYLKNICSNFGFGMTLDTSHLNHASPHLADWFKEVHPYIKNIHLSDFGKRQHLALGKGNLKTSSFLNYLRRKNYSNFITLELPVRVFYSRKKYVNDIKNSIEFIKDHFVN